MTLDALRPHRASVSGGIAAAVAGLTAAEVTIALLLVSALWLPPVVGGKAWIAPALLVLVLGAWRVAATRHAPRNALVFVAYLAVYAAAALHGGSIQADDAARYFVRPLVGLGVALAVVSATQRARVLAVVAAVVLVEAPVTAGQVAVALVRHGRGGWSPDSITGTFGPSQAGVVAVAAVAALAIVAAAWLARAIGPALAAALGIAGAAVGVFSGTRAVVGFVPGTLLAVVAVAATVARTRRLAVLAAVALLSVPLLYGATAALYPGAFTGALSSQQAVVLGGAQAQGIPPPPRTTVPPHRGGGARPKPRARGAPPPTPAAAPAPSGVLLLPGRFAQLKLAARLSHRSGPAVALVGRGLGASEQDPRWTLAQQVPPPERTGSTWIGRVLTEAGWLGLVAFAALVLWLTLVGRRLWRMRESLAVGDRVLGAALPGIAALTVAGAVWATILDVRGYSLPFWVVAGLAASAAGAARSGSAA